MKSFYDKQLNFHTHVLDCFSIYPTELYELKSFPLYEVFSYKIWQTCSIKMQKMYLCHRSCSVKMHVKPMALSTHIWGNISLTLDKNVDNDIHLTPELMMMTWQSFPYYWPFVWRISCFVADRASSFSACGGQWWEDLTHWCLGEVAVI